MNFERTWEQRHRKLVRFMKVIQFCMVSLIVPLMIGNLRLFILCFGIGIIVYYGIEIYQNFLESGIGNKILLLVHSILWGILLILSIMLSFYSAYTIPTVIGALTVGFLMFKAYRITEMGLLDSDIKLIISISLILVGSIITGMAFFINKILFYIIVASVGVIYWIYYWTVRFLMEKRDIRKDDIV